MIGTRVQQYMRRLVEKVMRPLARTGITPNMLTLLGLLLTIFTAGVIAFNHLRIGGVLVLCAGVFDMFDGAMARVAQKSSRFGAFFDSTLDRYAEGILLLRGSGRHSELCASCHDSRDSTTRQRSSCWQTPLGRG